MSSPYLRCPFVFNTEYDHGVCPFLKDCYDRVCKKDAVSEVPVLEADVVHFMEQN